jgi:hypothetical protein
MKVPLKISFTIPWPGDIKAPDKTLMETIKELLISPRKETWKGFVNRIVPKPKIDWGNLRDKIK